jgi:hypothetical protein
MEISDYDFKEWHDHVKKQRDRYKWFIRDILNGVPTIPGMASEYRKLTLDEIKKRARELLDD